MCCLQLLGLLCLQVAALELDAACANAKCSELQRHADTIAQLLHALPDLSGPVTDSPADVSEDGVAAVERLLAQYATLQVGNFLYSHAFLREALPARKSGLCQPQTAVFTQKVLEAGQVDKVESCLLALLLQEKYAGESKQRRDLHNQLMDMKGAIRVFCRCGAHDWLAIDG